MMDKDIREVIINVLQDSKEEPEIAPFLEILLLFSKLNEDSGARWAIDREKERLREKQRGGQKEVQDQIEKILSI